MFFNWNGSRCAILTGIVITALHTAALAQGQPPQSQPYTQQPVFQSSGGQPFERNTPPVRLQHPPRSLGDRQTGNGEMPPVYQANGNTSRRVQPAGQPGEDVGYYISDPQVEPTGFRQSAPDPRGGQPAPQQPIAQSEPIEVPRLNEYALTAPQEGKLDLGKTIQKIALSTLAVLVACVFVLIGLKKFGLTGPPAAAAAGPTSSNVVESFDIGSKCVAQIIRIHQHSILIVREPAGIKSVIHLPGSFRDELEQVKRAA